MSDTDLILCEILVLRCQRHDAGAPEELVALFERPLLYYLRRLAGSEADAWDLMQETWLAIFRFMPRLRDPRAFPAFLYRTARNGVHAHLRKRDADARLMAVADLPRAVDEVEPDFSAEDGAAVHAGLEKLSLPHREVLTLFFLQDLRLEEIASVLDVPAGTVKSRLHHAKKALAEILSKGADHV